MEGQGDQLEKVIGRVRDVLRARVVRDENGKVSEVRVLVSETRAPQKVIRDVTTAIRSQGEEVLPEDVHIAQMASEDWSALAGGRLRLEGIMFETRSTGAECRVSLALGEKLITGSAKGSPSLRESLRLVARATIEAMMGWFLEPSPEFNVEGVATVNMSGVATVVVLVSANGPDGLDYFSGSCPVRHDERTAAAKAALAAINRKFSLLVKGMGR